MNEAERNKLLHTLAHLRVDRASGNPAPHKPLLLLVLLHMAERDELPAVLPLTPELAFQFCTFWSAVAHRRTQRPNVRFPFHHLASDGLWTALRADTQPSSDRQATCFARLSPEFLALTRDARGREEARCVLIAQYLQPEERLALYALLGAEVPSAEDTAEIVRQAAGAEAERQGREARFRLDVVAAYSYTCALTGHRLLTIDAGAIVDAAHIRPFSNSRNNDPRNGLALCKNAHWTFDEGLWTITDEYGVVVASKLFAEESPDGLPLTEYQDRALRLPGDRSFWPDPDYLAWHRAHCFLRQT